MQFYPIVSKVNGKIVAGTSIENNGETLAKSINKHNGGEPVVFVGEPIPMNPSYSKAKDPERLMLTALLGAALETDAQPLRLAAAV